MNCDTKEARNSHATEPSIPSTGLPSSERLVEEISSLRKKVAHDDCARREDVHVVQVRAGGNGTKDALKQIACFPLGT